MAILSDTIINGNLSVTDELNINGVKVATMHDLEIVRQKIAKIVNKSITIITEKDLDGVTSIGIYAFYYCTSLTDITIPGSVTRIGERAFSYCTSLKSITFQGTMAQWSGISKGANWNANTGNYTIHCKDGNMAKS